MFEGQSITEADLKLLKEKYSPLELENIIKKIETEDYPVQYAIGNVQFLNYVYDVDSRVLIPRFATELLVSKLINYIKIYNLESTNMLDICSGSGCIAISLANEFPLARVSGVDISSDAIDVAKHNSEKYNKKIEFFEQDILREHVKGKYSVVVSNPPYVNRSEVVSANTKYEPDIALYPNGDDDIVFYKRIIDEAKSILEDKAIVAFEIGATQGSRILEYAKEHFPEEKIILEKDYEGFDRFVFIFKNCE